LDLTNSGYCALLFQDVIASCSLFLANFWDHTG
jgi:hypothetical protein